MPALFPLPKRIAKSTLSQYLRTKCDRQLYLSLHEPSQLEGAGLPVPMPARPGVGVLRDEGRTFEEQRNDKLIAAFGSNVLYATGAGNKPKQEALAVLLKSVSALPAFVLQGKIEPGKFQQRILKNLAVPAGLHGLIPRMDGLVPDIVVVRNLQPGDEAVTPQGGRRTLGPEDAERKALVVIDVKHTSEANPSYSAEVALYAVVLANWLEELGKDSEYYVAVKCALWTRFKEGASAFDAERAKEPKPAPDALLAALVLDSEDANLRFYLPTVLRFFREDLPRVIEVGDANPNSWRDLEWHVDSRCSSCDFLGYARWVPAEFRKKLEANPDHYCYKGAEISQHLSRIAGMTRGGRKTLQSAAITTTTAVAGTSGSEPVYGKHTFLKREGSKLPARAKALAADKLDVDATVLLATLAPWPQLSLSVAVNFDPSSGLLTGLGLGGSVTAYVIGQSPIRWKHQGFVVDQKSLVAEWTELKSFLSTLSDYIDQAVAYVTKHGKGRLQGQIAFWEVRQYEELCKAVGRHLPKVLALTDKKQRALAWMFPPEELLEKDTGAIPPCVVFVDEIVRRVVFAPVPHVITLFDTAEHYHAGGSTPVEKDAFYREFLSNGIPRERIYEIWSNEPEIVRGKVTKSRNSVVAEYIGALSKQSASVATVVERLRTDFKGNMKCSNPVIDLSNPTGAIGVAFDAKLWIWWDKLGLATQRAGAHQRLAKDGQALEADYEALRLRNGARIGATDVWSFDVLATSTEAKLEPGQSYLSVGLEGVPGFPLSSASDHLPKPWPTYAGNIRDLNQPLYSVVRATIETFDRVHRTATVRIETPSAPGLLQYLRQHAVIDLQSALFLTESKPSFDWSKVSAEILRAVGNPPIASPDLAAAKAMGAVVGKAGTSPATPLAEVLWSAPQVQARELVPGALAAALAATIADKDNLNSSQQLAVVHAIGHALTIVWGPPGTGKTSTLASYVHALVSRAATCKQGLKILLTGPTYKALEELVGRVIVLLDSDPTCSSGIYVCYSKTRQRMTVPATKMHLTVSVIGMGDDAYSTDCLPSLGDSSRITIVATGAMQCYKFGQDIASTPVAPIYDVVIIDESSQVEVTKALAPLSALKKDGRVVIAGDHLQLPPIAVVEAPVGAEYLVGSIQSYLIGRFAKVYTSTLTENYRSAADIVAYARTIGYPPQLTAHYPATALYPIAPLPSQGGGYPAALPWWSELDKIVAPAPAVVALLHDDDLSSQGNEIEAAIVTAIVWSLRATSSAHLDGRGNGAAHGPPTPDQFWGKCVGIVTPHRAQRALVIRELTKLFPSESSLIDEAVDTVEKFQGGERHAIIVSFGVADPDVIAGEEAFLMQLQRTNVAISRAQAKCIVVMPTALAGHVPQDKKALLTAHAIKGYVDDFCDQELPVTITLPGGTSRLGKIRFKA
jgi:hypothetical protein